MRPLAYSLFVFCLLLVAQATGNTAAARVFPVVIPDAPDNEDDPIQVAWEVYEERDPVPPAPLENKREPFVIHLRRANACAWILCFLFGAGIVAGIGFSILITE